VFFHVGFGSFVGVMPSVKRVSPCGVRMVGCFFMVSALMVFGCFGVMAGGVGMVFC
jgi:hypothetical protein